MTTDPTPLDLSQILRILMRRKLLLMLPWGIALGLGVAAAVLLPPVYFSSVTLLLERPQALSGALGNMVNAFNPDRQADLMRDQVQSTVFLRGVVAATGLVADPETRAWALRYASRYPGNNTDEQIEGFLVDQLRKSIVIRRAKGGNTFEVTVEDRRPLRAQRFAEAVAHQFVTGSKAAQIEAVQVMQEFSSEQQRVYKRKLEESEERLEAFKRGVLSTTLSGSSVSESSLPRARTLLEQAELDVGEQRQRVSALRAQLRPDYDPSRLSSSEVNVLAAQLKGLERQIAAAQLLPETGGSDNSMSARSASARKVAELEIQLMQNAAAAYSNASPDVRDIMVRYRLADIDLQAKDARRAYLGSQVGSYEQRVVMSPDVDAQLKKLEQEAETNRAFYNSFLQQSASAQITEAFENARVSGHFAILEPANLPRSPGKPNRLMLVLLAFVLGGGVGVGAVLLVERQDQSVKNAEEVETQLGLPVLGAIPRVDELDRRRRRSRSRSSSPLEPDRDPGLLHRLKTESPLGLEFRRIYLKLAKTRGRTLPTTLLMTSSTRGEGKTTTSACMGITLARELDQKVLIVDFDLRSPALHRALGIPSSSWGLSHMLAQRKFDERFVRSTVLPNLDFLSAGRSERPASELVDSESAEWFITEARARYGQVVIDSPPTLAVPDPLILGRVVDGVIYVIKAGQTIRKAAEYGVKVQREARDNIIGVLMNDAGEILPHYYGYHDAYGYASEAAGGDS